jgi:hypothetical protein
MVQPITQTRFKECFTPETGPPGSLWDQIQRRIVEIAWYEDTDQNRVGVIIFDGVDNDWQAITLQNYEGVYAAHEVRVSLPSQSQAYAVLMELFSLKTEDTAVEWYQMDRQSQGRTGKTLTEHLLCVPVGSHSMGTAPETRGSAG